MHYSLGKILWESVEWESNVCAAHRLQNAIKHAMEKNALQKLLHKCRRLVGHLKHSALATNGSEQKQKALGFTSIRHVIQEVPTRWNRTFHKVQRLVKLKQPIRLYLEDTLTDREIGSFDLSDVEWGIAKNILEAVDGTTTLSGEKYYTLSWCLPISMGLRDSAKWDEQDSVILTGIKKKLTDQLNWRFNLDKLKLNSSMILSTALDPRFRKLSFLTCEQRDEVCNILVVKQVQTVPA